MDPLLERPGGSHQRLDAQRSSGVCCVDELVCPVDGKTPMSKHAFGAVQQAQALLGQQLERLDSGCLEHRSGGNRFAVDQDFALADEGQRKMGEWSKVARCPDRSLRRHRRKDVLGEHCQEEANDLGPDTGVSLCEGSRTAQQHRTHDLRLEVGPDARSM